MRWDALPEPETANAIPKRHARFPCPVPGNQPADLPVVSHADTIITPAITAGYTSSQCGGESLAFLNCAIYVPRMSFVGLQDQLRKELRRRIDSSELTGMELARRTGFTQAHISNFLNRKRGLKLSALD